MDRRNFLKQAAVTASMLPIAGCLKNLQSCDNTDGRKPNVVLILTDDQGISDVGCYGSKDILTPNIDKLASQGIKFSQFYVASVVCSPSRAALLTGRYAQRAQLANNVSVPNGRPGLPLQQVTIAEMLKPAGYKTANIGKWHLGDVKHLRPNAQGFDYSFGHLNGCIDNYSHYLHWAASRPDLHRNGEKVYYPGQYFGDLMVDECKNFISENKKDPFFLYWAINMPHYPYQGKVKWLKKYLPHNTYQFANYAGFVSTMDEMIGQVIDHLEKLKLREDTLIIFLSDHGPSDLQRRFLGKKYNVPYRGHKTTLWEGGIRVPCIITFPGKIEKDKTSDSCAASMDILPTIADYCQVELPDRKLDGTSIRPAIDSQTPVKLHDVLHWHFNEQWAVLKDNWKLVHNGKETVEKGVKMPKVTNFLSDLSKDVSESVNLADKHPDIVKQLTDLHNQWVETVKQQ